MNRMNNCNYHTNAQSYAMHVKETGYVHSKNELAGMPLAMAYVPKQHFDQMFDLSKGLKMGTIFPELCLPFCGKRRNCTCKTTR